MEGIVQHITDRLFVRPLEQKTVHSINKEIEELLPDEKKFLQVDVALRVKNLLTEEPSEALKFVTLVCDGCSALRKSMGKCLEEILVVCTARLQTHLTDQHRKHSQFHIAVKALYSILQYVLPLQLQEQSEVTHLLERVYFSLVVSLTSDKLPSDCALITSTSLCLTVSCIKRENLEAEFMSVISTLQELQMNETGKHSEHSVVKTLRSSQKREKFLSERFRDINPSYPVALLLHGLFNSNVQWIYEYGSWSDIFMEIKSVSHDREGNVSHMDHRPSSKPCDVQPHPQVLIQKDSAVSEVGNIFLYEIYLLIKNLCNGATSYTFQAFQVLRLWLSAVRELGNRMRKDYTDYLGMVKQKSQGCSDYNVDYYRKNLPSGKWIFTIQSHENSVFHLLNSNWENPSKGVSDVVYACMVELLELHEDCEPGQARSKTGSMVSLLSSSDAWTSKSTYPPLALALSYTGAQDALLLCPGLPSGLMTSLSVNHLAPAGAKVYKIIVESLTLCLWSKYFFRIVCEALQSEDRLTQQNVMSLWLPPTLRQYPRVYLELLDGCQDTTGGWVARMAILRVARSLGTFNLKENDTALDHKLLSTLQVQKSITLPNDDSEKPRFIESKKSESSVNVEDQFCIKRQMTNHCVLSYLKLALGHLNETVRGEALSLLCHTQKASQPISLEESTCLKFFFKYNMNIDSAAFRQSIIKCYKALVVRLRDASATELKKLSFKALNVEESSTKFVRNFKTTHVLEVNTELLVWFIKLFHHNLAPDGNYQRRILSLQLYKETLLAFYEKKDSLTYSMPQRYMTVSTYINLTTNKEVCHNEKERENHHVTDLTLPWTWEMLLFSCLDEMNNIREEAENILKIVEFSRSPVCFSEVEEWMQRGLTLCNSPKASDVESGAALVQVVSSSCYNSGHDISALLKKLGMSCEAESLLSFLFGRVEAQFKTAQMNLLEASRSTPIHGSLMALGRCLVEDAQVAVLSPEDILDFIQRLADLMVQMVEFMLSILACASQNGSTVAPSFAEMGEAVELIIRKCGRSMGEFSRATPHIFGSEYIEDMEERQENADDEDNAISGDHQLLLACCWQTMKACCVLSSMCVSRWLDCLSESIIGKLLHGVVVRVLTGTRHKGAMEAARTAYNQLCYVLLTASSNIGQLIYKQVEEVLEQLKVGAQTSITRRAAGMAMMIQVACGAAPRINASLINNTITKLLNIAQTEYKEQSTLDSPPVLALHVLHSVVIHAPLAHHMSHHMPAITSICLQSFNSESWALRNAALQLYGAVVPRMVGQKKVRDDSSTLNSLTAPEFLSRHPTLADFLLHLLSGPENGREVHERLAHDTDRGGRTGPTEQLSIKMSSSLIPVLSLVSRLSPGTGLQQNKGLNDMLNKFCRVTNILLGSPVHTVRRLASLALVALTPAENVSLSVSNLIQTLRIPNQVSINLIHGYLLALANFVQIYPQLRKDQELKNDIVTSVGWLLKPNNKCYIIATLALKLFILLQVDHIRTDLKLIDLFQPGAAEYLQTLMKMKIDRNSQNEIEKILTSESSHIHNVEELCFDYLAHNFRTHNDSSWTNRIERLIWQRLEQKPSTHKSILTVMKLLCTILEENDTLYSVPSEKCIEKLLTLLKGCHGAKATSLALIIIAHLFGKLQDSQWPGGERKFDMLSTFTGVIRSYSDPTSTEDYRMAASSALKISMKSLLYDQQDVDSAYKEQIVIACMELLQDEDSDIRNSACHIVLSLTDAKDHTNKRNVSKENMSEKEPQTSDKPSLQKGLHPNSFRVQLYTLEVLHPNLAILELAKIITKKCVCTSDWSSFRVIWRICSGQHTDDFVSVYKSLNSSSYLFQSHTMNLYREPKQLSLTMAEAMLGALQGTNETEVQSDVPMWLQQECEILNKQGEILTQLISQQPQLSVQKQLLSVTSTYIVASKTLLSLSNIFNVPITITHHLSWNSSHFCVVDIQ